MAMRKYSNSETLIANIPYFLMLIIGAFTIAISFQYVATAIVGAAVYFVYGVVGMFWIMIFVCPYCAYYGARGCPCGYGIVAAKMVKKGDHNCFAVKFKRHIPVIVPLWFIPVICGGVSLWKSYSWPLIVIVMVFIVESFVILPLVSKKHGCVECPQKDECPWMK